MYKYLDKKRALQIHKIEKDFCKLSKILSKKKPNYNWWFHEVSRLDFRPWGGLNTNNFLKNDIDLSNFFYRYCKDFIKISLFIFNGFFFKYEKFFYKNIFISENILFTKNIKNYYFSGFYNKTKSRHKIITSLSKINDKEAKDLCSLVGFKDRVRCLLQSLLSHLRLYFFLKKLIQQKKIDKFWIDYFFIKENLKSMYINFLVFSFISKNNFCKNIIFPYEEKTLERTIISALSSTKTNNKVKVFGICVNPQHNLSSFLKKFQDIKIPRTDKYFFCGPMYRKYFKKLKRLNILSKNNNDCLGSTKNKTFKIKVKKNKTLLVLLSHIDEYHKLVKFIKEQKYLQKFEFIIRPYPHSLDEKKILNHLKKYHIENLQISKNSLKQDIKRCYAVIFSGTSAGIEAINFGRVGIWSNLSNVGINPLFDNVKDFLPALNGLQLQKKIQMLYKMSNIELIKVLKKQQNFCQQIYSKLNIGIIDSNLN